VTVAWDGSVLSRPTCSVTRSVWRGAAAAEGDRIVAEETPIALVYNATTQAVMMATPADLGDFAVGFSLSEGIVARPDEIEDIEIIGAKDGIEVRVTIAAEQRTALQQRRRHLAGPTGCGLCGVESLAAAMRPMPRLASALRVSPPAIAAALAALAARQAIHRETRAVHGAAFWRAGEGLLALREDVGRHNALDKLAGALARAARGAHDGLVLLTSRVSVEMVQKAAIMGAPVLVALSAPTALAVRACEASGITLVAIARSNGFEVFTHPQRVELR
jgi:FdhD protein